LILGVGASAFCMLMPVYLSGMGEAAGFPEYVKAILISIQHSIRLFAFDGGYMDVVSALEGLTPALRTAYTLLGSVLYFIAPLLTVSLLLSFFKNLFSYVRYVFFFRKNTHVFSELNEKSLALAKSLESEGNAKYGKYRILKRELIVFTGVVQDKDERALELIEEAKEMGAVLFTKDLESIKYRSKRYSKRQVRFYLISDNEEEKLRHAESIMREYDQTGVELRIFSNDIRSELLMATRNVTAMKAIRINEVQSLIYHSLDAHGVRLFENAKALDKSEKTISAVIVGMDRYGTEMLKALSWFCQLPGYRVKINAFDRDEYAEGRFTAECPDLMNGAYNGKDIPGEARYEIAIHGGIEFGTPEFYGALSQIKDATYIFVSLGEDSLNLSAAVKIRAACETVEYAGDNRKPDIETVIYNSGIRDGMGLKWAEETDGGSPEGIANFQNQSYNIHMIGDVENFYSVDTMIASALVEEGKRVHLRWGDEAGFLKYEYCYRSSIAKAMHERLRVKMKLDIPGIRKAWEERTEDEKLAIGTVEHVRWNAYMRSEGYRYSGNRDKASRNDLGKLHNDLVPVTELSDDDLRKDA
ncbi:MAG: hypothetical protein IJY04_10015, partial [Clostridia bacterium]|nr:hypothetical protein [Clostridia bacterium]